MDRYIVTVADDCDDNVPVDDSRRTKIYENIVGDGLLDADFHLLYQTRDVVVRVNLDAIDADRLVEMRLSNREPASLRRRRAATVAEDKVEADMRSGAGKRQYCDVFVQARSAEGALSSDG